MKIFFLAPALIIALPLSAAAAAGAFEINQDCALAGCFSGDSAGYPITIMQSGSYVLTSDLTVASGQDGIDIQAGLVDLDLNGHTIDGGGTCTGTPVSSCTSATSDGVYLSIASASGHIRIHNGTVRGFGNSGIEGGEFGNGAVFEDLTLAENSASGVNLSSNAYASTARFRNVNFVRNVPTGLFTSIKASIDDCLLSGNYSYGISDHVGATITNSRFGQNGNVGVLSVAPSNAVAMSHNVFDHNNAGGIQWKVTTSFLDMGGNVCTDHACP